MKTWGSYFTSAPNGGDCGQLRVSAALLMEKELPVPIVQDAVLPPEPVRVPLPGIEPGRPPVAIPTELFLLK
jgi:hypothetical protein